MPLFDLDWGRERLGWVIVGVVVSGGVALALLDYLGTLVFALFVYYASRPVQERMEPRFNHPDAATTVTILAFVLPILALVGYGLFVALQEAIAFVQTAGQDGWFGSILGPYVELSALLDPGTLIERLREDPDQVLDESTRQLITRVIGPVQTIAGFLFAVLSRLFLMFVFVFYLLRDDEKIAAWFRRSFGHDSRVIRYASAADRDLEHLFWGNAMTILATGLIAVATFYALDLLTPPTMVIYRPVLLGLLVGVATLVPLVGMKIIYVPFTLLLVVQTAVGSAPVWFPVLFFVVTFVVVDALPDFFVRAYLSAGELNMGLVLLAYTLGTMAFGWYGLFLGPILLVGFVNFARDVFPQLVRNQRIE